MFVWTIGDAVSLTLMALVIVIALIFTIINSIKEATCKHDGGVNETMACDAICRKCGKNLGFIGTWRKKQKEQS